MIQPMVIFHQVIQSSIESSVYAHKADETESEVKVDRKHVTG